MPQVLYARIFTKTRPEIGAAEEEICGGHMIFAGLGSPIGRVTGAGLDRAFTAEDLDRVEEFYRARNAPSQVDLCPLHSPEVFAMFEERGYAIAELNNVLFRKLEAGEKFPSPPEGCEILPERGAKANYESSRVLQYFLHSGMLFRRSWQAQSLELLALALNIEEYHKVIAQPMSLVFHRFLTKWHAEKSPYRSQTKF